MKIIEANIFTSKCKFLVNTINCEGVMGAGLALEFRLRYPAMYAKYVELCKDRKIRPGSLWIYKADDRSILNFPTKNAWRLPSRREYLELGLRKFVETYERKGIRSIAFPILGANKGGMNRDESIQVMEKYLGPIVDIEIEVYDYSDGYRDDIYLSVKSFVDSLDDARLAEVTGIKLPIVRRIREAMGGEDVRQLGQLGCVSGIGIRTLEKLFEVSRRGSDKLEFLQGRLL